MNASIAVQQVNGDVVILKYTLLAENGDEKVTIFYSGKNVRIETDFGLVIEFDGYFTQVVDVPNEASGKIQGLCGNYNNDETDDKILPDNTDLTYDLQGDSKIAAYYQVTDANDT